MRILVVDDSGAMRKIIIKHLGTAGYAHARVREAGNGVEALVLAREEPPDLVLADWNMPEMGGLELFRALRAERSLAKVAFITSEVSSESRRAVIDEGALFVLAKPFSGADLRGALAEAFSKEPVALPSLAAVESLLGTLLERTVRVRRGMPVVFGPSATVMVGVFERRSGAASALVVTDAPLAAFLGAAFGTFEPESALRAVEKGEGGGEFFEHLREVFNVCARLFKSTDGQGLSLRTVRSHPPALPIEVASLAATAPLRLSLTVEIEGLGSGQLSVLARP